MPKRLIPILLAALIFSIMYAMYAVAHAQERGPKLHYYDIYLTQDRICKGCIVQQSGAQITLVSRDGRKATVDANEVIGVDNHPLIRKFLTKSAQGNGLAGKVLLPEAFQDGQDFICKYCE